MRTAPSGAALLEFTRLPREFTVEVNGGWAGGRRLPGTLAAVVRGYRAGAVVYVNPVTTLVADVFAASKRAGADARRRVYAFLKLPSWMDGQDLSYSGRYFDGGAYLQAARHAGGLAALGRRLASRVLSGRGSQPFLPGGAIVAPRVTGGPDRRSVTRTGVRAQAAKVDWAALLKAGNSKALVKEAFKLLSLQAGKSLVSIGLNKAGTAALGWVLAAFGFEDSLPDEDIVAIRQAVEALGRQVTQLQENVALAGFTTLIHQTDQTIGRIDHASSQLALLANTPDHDPTKRAFAQTIVDYIGANLIDAPQILNQGLGSKLPVADNFIKAASRTVSQRGRFFDSKSSAQVEGVYDYFASYQVQLAMLLQEYYHAKPQIYSPTNAEANLAMIEKNVAAQAASLKPSVPHHAVIDTKTRDMWVQVLPTPEVSLSRIGEIYHVRGARGRHYPKFRLTKAAGPTALPGFGFSNWELPTTGDFERLIAGWSGSDPLDWLDKQGHFSKALLEAGGRKWVRDGFTIPFGAFIAATVRNPDLRSPRGTVKFPIPDRVAHRSRPGAKVRPAESRPHVHAQAESRRELLVVGLSDRPPGEPARRQPRRPPQSACLIMSAPVSLRHPGPPRVSRTTGRAPPGRPSPSPAIASAGQPTAGQRYLSSRSDGDFA